MPAARPLVDRFWEKVRKGDGCWEWTGAVNPNGQGRINADRSSKPLASSRVSWSLHFGAIPDGGSIKQRCGNKGCVRPDHLVLSTGGGRLETDPATRFWNKVEKGEGCWNWTGRVLWNGYGTLWNNGGTDVYAHRLSWEMHNGPIPDGLYVLHRCDNRRCVRPDHLLLGTNADNFADMRAKRRHAKGTMLPQAKLDDDKVREIRKLAGLTSQGAMARRFGVGQGQIAKVIARKAWRHVGDA